MQPRAGNGGGGGRQIVPAKNDPASRVKMLFERALPQLKSVVPAGVDPTRIMRLGLGAVLHDPNLLKCTPASLLLALLKLTALGLEPNTPLQQAYIVGYRTKKKIKRGGAVIEEWVDEAQPIVGYRGQILLAVQTGAIVDVDGDVVHAKDYRKVSRGLHMNLEHEPHLGGDHGDMDGVYCTWELANGLKKFRYWDNDKIRGYFDKYGYNGSGSSRYMKSTYKQHPEAMALKGVIHDAARFWPINGETARGLSKAFEINEREAKGLPPDFSEERSKIAEAAPGLVSILEEGGDYFDLEPPEVGGDVEYDESGPAADESIPDNSPSATEAPRTAATPADRAAPIRRAARAAPQQSLIDEPPNPDDDGR